MRILSKLLVRRPNYIGHMAEPPSKSSVRATPRFSAAPEFRDTTSLHWRQHLRANENATLYREAVRH